MAKRSKSRWGGFGISHDWGKGGLSYKAGCGPFYSRPTEVPFTPGGALRRAIPNVRRRTSSPRNYPLCDRASYSRSRGYTPGISPWLDGA